MYQNKKELAVIDIKYIIVFGVAKGTSYKLYNGNEHNRTGNNKQQYPKC